MEAQGPYHLSVHIGAYCLASILRRHAVSLLAGHLQDLLHFRGGEGPRGLRLDVALG
jgi:hypothetical protein